MAQFHKKFRFLQALQVHVLFSGYNASFSKWTQRHFQLQPHNSVWRCASISAQLLRGEGKLASIVGLIPFVFLYQSNMLHSELWSCKRIYWAQFCSDKWPQHLFLISSLVDEGLHITANPHLCWFIVLTIFIDDSNKVQKHKKITRDTIHILLKTQERNIKKKSN